MTLIFPYSTSSNANELVSSSVANGTKYRLVDKYELLPSLDLGPVITNVLHESFIQYSYPSQSIQRDDNVIECLENTTFSLQCIATNPVGDDELLEYTWKKNGNTIQVNVGYEGSILFITGSDCVESLSGLYNCEVRNQYKIESSTAVTLLIHNTASISLFNSNIIANPCAHEGINDWISDSEQFGVKPLSDLSYQYITNSITNRDVCVDIPFYTFNDGNIRSRLETGAHKKLNNTIFNGYSSQDFVQFFPPPTALVNDANIKLSSNIISPGSNFYFTRTELSYDTSDTANIITAYQDIDISQIESFIKSKVYGVEYVSLSGICYIGASLSYYDSIHLLGVLEDITRIKFEFYDRNNVKINSYYEGLIERPDIINGPTLCDLIENTADLLSFNGCALIKGYPFSLINIPYNTNFIRCIMEFEHTGKQPSVVNPEMYDWDTTEVHKNSFALGINAKTNNSKTKQQIQRSLIYGNPRQLVTGLFGILSPNNAIDYFQLFPPLTQPQINLINLQP